MAMIEELYKARDQLDSLERLYSTETLLEAYLVKARSNVKVIRNQIVNSLKAKQWADTLKDRLKFPAAKDAFISWQRAMTGSRKALVETASFAVKIKYAVPNPPPRFGGLPPDLRKKAEEDYKKHLEQVEARNKELEAEAKRLNELFDKEYQAKLEPPLLQAVEGMKKVIIAVVNSAGTMAAAAIEQEPRNSERRPALEQRFERARNLAMEMNAAGDATLANIGQQAWSTFMLCLKK